MILSVNALLSAGNNNHQLFVLPVLSRAPPRAGYSLGAWVLQRKGQEFDKMAAARFINWTNDRVQAARGNAIEPATETLNISRIADHVWVPLTF